MKTELMAYVTQAAADTERTLDYLLPSQPDAPETELYDAMRYSLLAGGKRLRPAMFLATLDIFGQTHEKLLPFAAALEMIHTYSLIHDDLPAMDNDDMRRGRPTCHRAYSETTAILAGDGLLTHAFALMVDPIEDIDPARQLRAVAEVAQCAGLCGMVAGQAAEFAAADKKMTSEMLAYIDTRKTASLFAAAVLSAAQLCGATGPQLEALRVYARESGLAFQITDDVLDVRGDEAKLGKPVGSDAKNQRVTYATLLGCDEAQQRAKQSAGRAVDALKIFDERARVLRGFPLLWTERNN